MKRKTGVVGFVLVAGCLSGWGSGEGGKLVGGQPMPEVRAREAWPLVSSMLPPGLNGLIGSREHFVFSPFCWRVFGVSRTRQRCGNLPRWNE